jgi:hypothetical protein
MKIVLYVIEIVTSYEYIIIIPYRLVIFFCIKSLYVLEKHKLKSNISKNKI